MENKVINIKIVAQVAHALQELKDKMVFVGGAVISLYTDDPAADELRPTADIDMAIQHFSNLKHNIIISRTGIEFLNGIRKTAQERAWYPQH